MLALLVAAWNTLAVSIAPGLPDAKEAQVAIDSDNRVYVTYGVGNAIYLSVSKDQAASFSEPIKVAEAGKISLGMRRGPRIAVHDGVVTITATYGKEGGGRDGDLLAFKSSDHGQTWSGPARVNDVEGSGREGLHGMAAASDGTLVCTWLDLRTKGTKLYMSVSKDGGAAWSANRLVYASPSGTICQCCSPTVGFDAKGKLYVMFRNVIAGARDMYLTTSSDLGNTFTPAKKLGTGTWMLDACPMDGGSFTVSPDGKFVAVWRREGTLYSSGPTGEETPLGRGSQAWVTQGEQGYFATWTEGANLLAMRPGADADTISTSANNSVVVASPDRKLVVAAWTERGIRVARLSTG